MNYDDERVNRTFNMFLFLIAVAFFIGVIAGITGCYFIDLAVLESLQ